MGNARLQTSLPCSSYLSLCSPWHGQPRRESVRDWGGGGRLIRNFDKKKIITYSSSYSVGAGVSVNLPDNFFMLIKGVRVANPSKFIFFEEKKNHEKKTF